MYRKSLFGKDWKTIFRRLKKGVWHPFLKKIYHPFFSLKGHEGVQMMEEDWDYLIILDACRYDTFKEVNWLEGRLEKKISPGSATPEWLQKTFTEYCDDTVYVSGNGFVSPDESRGGFDSSKHFHDMIPVYLDDDATEKGSIKPEAMTEAAIKADKEYPHKRKIIHYVQPHDPFIGEPSITKEGGDVEDRFEYFIKENGYEAYVGNLKRALRAVEGLIEHIEGKIVITADHGEAFGEKGMLRHNMGLYTKELVEIPWFVIEKGERPKIHSDETSGIEI